MDYATTITMGLKVLAGFAVLGCLVWAKTTIKKAQLASFREDELKKIKKIDENKDKLNVETKKKNTEFAGGDNNRNRGLWK